MMQVRVAHSWGRRGKWTAPFCATGISGHQNTCATPVLRYQQEAHGTWWGLRNQTKHLKRTPALHFQPSEATHSSILYFFFLFQKLYSNVKAVPLCGMCPCRCSTVFWKGHCVTHRTWRQLITHPSNPWLLCYMQLPQTHRHVTK